MQFLRPGLITQSLVPWLVLAVCAFWSLRSLVRVRRRLAIAPTRETSRPSSIARRGLRLALGLAAIACIIVALARPVVVRDRFVPDRQILDAVVLLDTSPSMRAQDIYPSRIARATEVIGSFIRRKLPEDRFGLVSFSQNALVLSYLTADPDNLEFYMEYLRRLGTVQYGTNIGGALKNAMVVLTRQTEIEPDMAGHKTVFILVSDGEDYGDELKAAVVEVVKRNIPVYSIGIGSRNGALIPIGEENGEMKYLTGKNGEPLVTAFDETTLRQVAGESGGKYYRAQTGAELSKAFEDIFLRAREIRGYRRVRESIEQYRGFLAAALGLALLKGIL